MMEIEPLHIIKYCVSTFLIILLICFLITMIYIMRSVIKIPNGCYTWITNICTIILFLFLFVCLILGLVYFSPSEFTENADFDSTMREELSTEFSLFISRYAIYPILVVEMVIYVSLNSNLLWSWYMAGELDTIVNKIISMQRMLGIFSTFGWTVDYGTRLFGDPSFSWITTENYCACWIIFYKSIFYLAMGFYFSNAFIRFLCVEYPIEYHRR